MLHEKIGQSLADALALPALAGLRPVGLGELLVWGVIALPLGLALLTVHRRAEGLARANSRVFMAIAAGLVAVAVGVDMVHSMTLFSAPLRQGLTFLETGGELAAMTLFLAWSIHIATRISAAGYRRTGRGKGTAGPSAPDALPAHGGFG